MYVTSTFWHSIIRFYNKAGTNNDTGKDHCDFKETVHQKFLESVEDHVSMSASIKVRQSYEVNVIGILDSAVENKNENVPRKDEQTFHLYNSFPGIYIELLGFEICF